MLRVIYIYCTGGFCVGAKPKPHHGFRVFRLGMIRAFFQVPLMIAKIRGSQQLGFGSGDCVLYFLMF